MGQFFWAVWTAVFGGLAVGAFLVVALDISQWSPPMAPGAPVPPVALVIAGLLPALLGMTAFAEAVRNGP